MLDAKGKPKPPPKKKVGREGTRSSNRTTRPSQQAGRPGAMVADCCRGRAVTVGGVQLTPEEEARLKELANQKGRPDPNNGPNGARQPHLMTMLLTLTTTKTEVKEEAVS